MSLERMADGIYLVWDDFQFYNALGFHIYFNDDAMEKVVHIQAWTLGIGETVWHHCKKLSYLSPLKHQTSLFRLMH